MLVESIFRFLIGGLVVSAFALIGDLLRPKSFAGLFGAAPSVALVTLGLTFAKHGASYVSVEGRSMMIGAVSLLVYSQLVAWLLMRFKWPSLVVALLGLSVWLAVAFGVWAVVLR